MFNPFPYSSIGSGNELNMYLNPRVHGSIPMEDKNSTSERGDEDREIAVPRTSKARAVIVKKNDIFNYYNMF
jgi:hypothetical protein